MNNTSETAAPAEDALERVAYFLCAILDGIDNETHHCEPLPLASSWRFMASKAALALAAYRGEKHE